MFLRQALSQNDFQRNKIALGAIIKEEKPPPLAAFRHIWGTLLLGVSFLPHSLISKLFPLILDWFAQFQSVDSTQRGESLRNECPQGAPATAGRKSCVIIASAHALTVRAFTLQKLICCLSQDRENVSFPGLGHIPNQKLGPAQLDQEGLAGTREATKYV